jgi:hypothetical protein
MNETHSAANSTGASPFANLGLFNADDLRMWCEKQGDNEFLVPGFLPRQPIILEAGRSGEGKSPWNLQLAISLDLGLPFLDFPTGKRITSLICSGEDSPIDTLAQIERQTRHLTGCTQTPPGVLVFSANAFPEHFNLTDLEKRIALFRPGIVFLDPAIHFFPSLESGADAVDAAYSLLRSWEKKYGCVFVLVHHLIKGLHERENYEPLCACYPQPRKWFDHVRGTSALVNYADLRIGFDVSDSGALHVGGYKRATGNLPLVWLDRASEPDDATPLAYTRLYDEAMLSPAKRNAYHKLPDPFTPADVKSLTTWKHDSQVHSFINDLAGLGLVRQSAARQPYYKVKRTGNASG